ncbi:urease accessory protein UreD [Altericista sp. CCNU0014]|uniref:urease accessory protein UreD n=1 Tax=Altericista sp. CCNU0014 TaxID=3082949 RepID=UPI0038505C4C
MNFNEPQLSDGQVRVRCSNAVVPAKPEASAVWQGAIRLHYDRVEAKTQLAEVWHQAPLKVQRSLYPESNGICHTILIHTAGGMVGGDRLNYRLTLAPHAHAVVTTAAASKIYCAQGKQTEQVVEIDIAEDAYLEWLPQEAIVFDRARFQQTLRVNLAPRASWLGWDIYRFGRTARGERFLEGEWRSQTEVWRSGAPLWIDRQWLPGSQEAIDRPHGLNRCSVVGTFAWIGREVDRDLVQQLRESWTALGLAGEAGVSRLQEGVICRYRGQSTAEVRQWFAQAWDRVRFYAIGQPACPVRVWQV